MYSKLPRLAITLLFCTPVLATADSTHCTNGSLQRTVEVVYSNPGQPVPCEVLYDKPSEGTQQSLWRANNEAGYCEDRAREFIGRLEELGWACGAAGTDAPEEPEASEEPTEPEGETAANS